jgi:hypothetical protein
MKRPLSDRDFYEMTKRNRFQRNDKAWSILLLSFRRNLPENEASSY